LGSSNRSGENNGVNSAWYLILEAIDEAFGVEGFKILGTSAIKKKKNKYLYIYIYIYKEKLILTFPILLQLRS
jgi:hypothetical protein